MYKWNSPKWTVLGYKKGNMKVTFFSWAILLQSSTKKRNLDTHETIYTRDKPISWQKGGQARPALKKYVTDIKENLQAYKKREQNNVH